MLTNAVVAASADSPIPQNKKLNILAVSGGGQFGSYAAGIMSGWTCRGDRPQFDIITGISSGALLAVLIYAGPKYDPLMVRTFTTLKTEELFKYRPVLVHMIRDDALATANPLKEMIEREIHDDFVAEMCVAHKQGRRLFVGTMNVLTRKPTIWDLGAIAASGRPDAGDQVRKLLLATASISGMTPPVPIDVEVNGVCCREYHVDGGGVIQSFIQFGPEAPRPDPNNPSARWLEGSNLYLIGGGKTYKEVLDKPPGIIGSMMSNVSANLYALFRADARQLLTLCVLSGMKYHMSSVPKDAFTGERSTEFDPEIQRQLFTRGYDLMMSDKAWRLTPPGYEPGEEVIPRAGFQFTVPAENNPQPTTLPQPNPLSPVPATIPPITSGPGKEAPSPGSKSRHIQRTVFNMPKL